MTKSDEALALFREGFSCSQAVLAVFAGDNGLSREAALRITQPFGGGIAGSGDWCGAVTGAFLAIGHRFGRFRADDMAAKDKTYALVREFLARFRTLHAAVRCNDLLGCDIGTPEGRNAIDEKNLHQTVCETLVRDAVRILEDIL
jgi:C_GCAxxG_C_C family probable redox protein